LINSGHFSKAVFLFFAYLEKQLKLGLKINFNGPFLRSTIKILLKSTFWDLLDSKLKEFT